MELFAGVPALDLFQYNVVDNFFSLTVATMGAAAIFFFAARGERDSAERERGDHGNGEADGRRETGDRAHGKLQRTRCEGKPLDQVVTRAASVQNGALP